MKATKQFRYIIKTLANAPMDEVLGKLDEKAAETQAAIGDVPKALGNIALIAARLTEHQALTFRLLSEGLHDMGSTLSEPADVLADQAGPDLPKDEPVMMKVDPSYDRGTHYLIGRDQNDEAVFYGPGSKELCLEILRDCSSEENLDLTGPKMAKASGNIKPLHQLASLTDGGLLNRAAALDPEFSA